MWAVGAIWWWRIHRGARRNRRKYYSLLRSTGVVQGAMLAMLMLHLRTICTGAMNWRPCTVVCFFDFTLAPPSMLAVLSCLHGAHQRALRATEEKMIWRGMQPSLLDIYFWARSMRHGIPLGWGGGVQCAGPPIEFHVNESLHRPLDLSISVWYNAMTVHRGSHGTKKKWNRKKREDLMGRLWDDKISSWFTTRT